MGGEGDLPGRLHHRRRHLHPLWSPAMGQPHHCLPRLLLPHPLPRGLHLHLLVILTFTQKFFDGQGNETFGNLNFSNEGSGSGGNVDFKPLHFDGKIPGQEGHCQGETKINMKGTLCATKTGLVWRLLQLWAHNRTCHRSFHVRRRRFSNYLFKNIFICVSLFFWKSSFRFLSPVCCHRHCDPPLWLPRSLYHRCEFLPFLAFTLLGSSAVFV